ncbi:MAG TPA: hypothetical protein DEB17_05835 [Chlorobaculum sp.]|uniref:Uncharacterized protein n=1 Tax=Chlorobaculum tepidum (strain ATCC 49652 / DSM 12025 / NBRC 103806 / TLS) TaxID=194439 RepID=Q8KF41_CHLTE|nr:hypothetical protein CT0491 [Chlorobaculum tepidum TLS]HBU23506.1 hypothetical protein [Chlorobaculum sp.]
MLVKAKDYGIACVGITDYFLINSYKRLIELINDDSRLNALLNPPYADYAKQLLVLPNIEFRSSTIVRHVDIEGKTATREPIFTSFSPTQFRRKRLKRIFFES